MKAGDWIALYAAIVATGALVWQATTQFLQRRQRIRVSWFLMHLVGDGRPDRDRLDEWMRQQPWLVQREVLNLSPSRPARVGRIHVRSSQTEQGYEVWESVDWGLPWVLEPGEERVVTLTDREAGRLSTGQHLVAVERSDLCF